MLDKTRHMVVVVVIVKQSLLNSSVYRRDNCNSCMGLDMRCKVVVVHSLLWVRILVVVVVVPPAVAAAVAADGGGADGGGGGVVVDDIASCNRLVHSKWRLWRFPQLSVR
jgi:hypothetical protein